MIYSKIALVDEENNLLGIYDGATPFSTRNKSYIVVKEGKKVGLLNLDAKMILPCKYDCISNFMDEFILIREGDYVSLANEEGTIITATDRYIKIDKFRDGLAEVKIPVVGARLYGCIDKNGKEIIEAKYEEINNIEDQEFVRVKLNSRFGLMRRDGTVVGEIKYSYVSLFMSGRARVTLNEKHNYMDGNGNMIYDIWFDEPIETFSDFGVAIVKSNFKYGMVSEDGKIIHYPEYDEIQYFDNDGISIAKKSGKYGYISIDGKKLTDCIFDSAKPFNGNLKAKVRIGMKSYSLGRDFKLY